MLYRAPNEQVEFTGGRLGDCSAHGMYRVVKISGDTCCEGATDAAIGRARLRGTMVGYCGGGRKECNEVQVEGILLGRKLSLDRYGVTHVLTRGNLHTGDNQAKGPGHSGPASRRCVRRGLVGGGFAVAVPGCL